MNDREKVIRGLECCGHVAKMCDRCPYDENRIRYGQGLGPPCNSFLASDALEMIEAWNRRVEDGRANPEDD